MPPHDPSARDDASGYLFTLEPGESWRGHILPATLAIIMVGIWLFSTPTFGGASWAVSRDALEQGRFWLLVLHMFAHGGLLHVAMNAASLLVLSAPLIKHLGRPPISLARYLYLFVGSGISGAVLFLAINTDDYSSMLDV